MRTILFEDDFNGDTLKPTWTTRTHDGDPRAVSVHGGCVYLRTIPNPDGAHVNPWLSGHIGTGEVGGSDNAFEVTPPCSVEARIRFHGYHGSHAALWLAPSTDYEKGQSEVDIAEWFGAHRPERRRGVALHQNVYWREPWQIAGQFSGATVKTNSTIIGKRLDETFNRYRLDWHEDRYEFSVNGIPTGTIRRGLSVLPHFLVLSMLTRAYEVDDLDHGHPLPIMAVDWVKVWRN